MIPAPTPHTLSHDPRTRRTTLSAVARRTHDAPRTALAPREGPAAPLTRLADVAPIDVLVIDRNARRAQFICASLVAARMRCTAVDDHAAIESTLRLRTPGAQAQRYDAIILAADTHEDAWRSASIAELARAKALAPAAVLISSLALDAEGAGLQDLAGRLAGLARLSPDASAEAVIETVRATLCGNLRLAHDADGVIVDGAPIALPMSQRLVLREMMREPGRPVTHERLRSVYRGIDTDAALMATVRKLRQALADAGADIAIATVYGVGFVLDRPSRLAPLAQAPAAPRKAVNG